MAFRIGDTVPPDNRRRPFGDPCPSAWYAFRTPPMREAGAGAWLRKVGAVEYWFPVEPYRKWNSYLGEFVDLERKVAPGYVFTLCDRVVNWDVLYAEAGRRLNGVVSLRSGKPMPISDRDFARMRQVPQRIEAELDRIRSESEAAAAEAERARIAELPVAGALAMFTAGPFTGEIGPVIALSGEWADVDCRGHVITAHVGILRRVDGSASL